MRGLKIKLLLIVIISVFTFSAVAMFIEQTQTMMAGILGIEQTSQAVEVSGNKDLSADVLALKSIVEKELLTLQRQQMTIIREAEMNSKLNQQLLNTMMWFHEIEGFQAMDSLPLIEAKKQYQELLESQIKTAHHRKKYNQVGDD